jgi:hypothetical protein
MVECHYEMNIALNGRHYARMIFPSSLFEEEEEVKTRAKFIRDSLTGAGTWECSLMYVDCSGHDLAF